MCSQRKRLPIRNIVNDIFDGVTNLELMTKYRIVWASDLYRLFNRLIARGLVNKDEIRNRRPERLTEKSGREESDEKPVILGKSKNLDGRVAPRNKFFVSVEICGVTIHLCSYGIQIKDISESGHGWLLSRLSRMMFETL